MKPKKITGLVTGIVDGNTIEVRVQTNSSVKDGAQRQTETIRIQGLNKPATTTLSGILAKLELEKRIAGHTIECEIVGQGAANQLIAVVPKRFLRSPFDFNPAED